MSLPTSRPSTIPHAHAAWRPPHTVALLASLLLAASVVLVPSPAAAAPPAARPGREALRASPLTVQPSRPRPGDPVLVTVRGADAQPPSGTLEGRALRFFPVPGGYQALGSLPVERAPGPLEVVVERPGAGPLHTTVQVAEPRWRTRELKVAREFTEPTPELKERLAEDQAAFTRAFDQPPTPALFRGRFALPRKDSLTGRFGDRRTYNGQTQSQHYGLDVDGDVGDPVRSANDGQVVMVRECWASGNTVLVHHGAGIFTAYFHLTDFKVQEGQQVKRGELLGTVGRTGRVTGAHLHWGVRVGGLYVDPETLLKLGFL